MFATFSRASVLVCACATRCWAKNLSTLRCAVIGNDVTHADVWEGFLNSLWSVCSPIDNGSCKWFVGRFYSYVKKDQLYILFFFFLSWLSLMLAIALPFSCKFADTQWMCRVQQTHPPTSTVWRKNAVFSIFVQKGVVTTMLFQLQLRSDSQTLMLGGPSQLA